MTSRSDETRSSPSRAGDEMHEAPDRPSSSSRHHDEQKHDGHKHDGHKKSKAMAAAQAAERSTLRLRFPGLGTLALPPPEELVYTGGIVALAAVGIMEWPVAIVIATGHVLAHNRHIRLLRDFGEALEEA